jgi:hypothetical protein
MLASGVTIGLAAWAGSAAFHSRIGNDGVRAIVMSAGVAFTVQCLTFGVALALVPSSLMAGWGAGILIRVFTLAIHGFVGVPLLGLRADAALLSLAAFFFLSTLIEPFFLPRPQVKPAEKPPSTTS